VVERRVEQGLLRAVGRQLAHEVPHRLGHEAAEVVVGAPVGDGVVVEVPGALHVLGEPALAEPGTLVAPDVEERTLACERAHHEAFLEARELEVQARERRLHRLRARPVRLQLVARKAEGGREAQEQLERRARHLVEAGLTIHQRRQRDEEPPPPAARDHGGGALRVEPDELVVVPDPASQRLAIGAAVLEGVGERGLDRMPAHQDLQLLDEGVDGDGRRRPLEGVQVEELAGVQEGGWRGRLPERRGHGAR
jgi:hypothetical protein